MAHTESQLLHTIHASYQRNIPAEFHSRRISLCSTGSGSNSSYASSSDDNVFSQRQMAANGISRQYGNTDQSSHENSAYAHSADESLRPAGNHIIGQHSQSAFTGYQRDTTQEPGYHRLQSLRNQGLESRDRSPLTIGQSNLFYGVISDQHGGHFNDAMSSSNSQHSIESWQSVCNRSEHGALRNPILNNLQVRSGVP